MEILRGNVYLNETTDTQEVKPLKPPKIDEKIMEEVKPMVTPMVDETMAKELESVESTVSQLLSQLEKERQERKELELELEKQRLKCEKMEKEMARELMQKKKEITMIMNEYEESLSQQIADRERELRTIFEQEKAELQDDIQVAKDRLGNMETAVDDIHLKYERLRTAATELESVLKQKLLEICVTDKMLKAKYDQLENSIKAQCKKIDRITDRIASKLKARRNRAVRYRQ